MSGAAAGPRKGLVVVTGATGRQGGAVARRLVADGWTVRGVTRDPQSAKADRLRAAGVEVVPGDMGDRESLIAAFRGAHGVYNVQNPMISGHEAEIAQGVNVADAAHATGIRHVVYGSAGVGGRRTGVQQWDAKLDVADRFRTLGVPLTVLRPYAFMELMTDKAFYPQFSTWHVMPKLVGWDRELPWICVDDLAVIAASAFANPEDFVGQDLSVAADVKTLADCRSTWQAVRGRPPRSYPMPTFLFERFVGPDLPRMWRWLRENRVEADVGRTRELHPGALTVAEWLTAKSAV